MVEFFKEVDKDRDDGIMMKFFLEVESSTKKPEESDEFYSYESDSYESESDESDSDESEYDLEEYWKKWEKEYAEYEKKLESWKEGGKEGECVFTPDCKQVSSSSPSPSSFFFINIITIIK